MPTHPTPNENHVENAFMDAMSSAAKKFSPLDYRQAANLMVHPAAGLAVFSAVGFGIAGHMMGLVAGTMAGALEATRRMPESAPDISETVNAFVDLTESGMAVSDAEAEADVVTEDAFRSLEPGVRKRDSEGESVELSAPEVVAKGSARPAAPSLMPEDFKQPASMQRPETVDDLKRISGIGPKLEQVLNGLGIWTFEQISGWNAAEIAWVDDYLQFKGRIGRDDWIAQASAMKNTNAGSK